MNRRELLVNGGLAATGLLRRQPGLGSLLAQETPIAKLQPPPPDPLVFAGGGRVLAAKQWPARRLEILKTASAQMYGTAPIRPPKMRFEILEREGTYFGGAAIRRQVRLHLDGPGGSTAVDLLIYLPAKRKRPPLVLGMNFWGNHTVCSDPEVRLSRSWIEDGKNPFIDLGCIADHRATDACRGIDARRWPVEALIKRGHGLATFYRGDIDSDLPGGFDTSLRAVFPDLQAREDNFSTIGAWAWTLSRALDYLETDHSVNARRVAVFGWSRAGKAAVWAGACDERFAAVLSQESGAGGAKLFRRNTGENIRRLNTVFPHWYCKNFRQYNDRDSELPFDQHLILSAIAPRPIHIASAVDDRMSDPPGEFLSAVLATPVYKFLGSTGLPTMEMPPVNSPAFGRISYHIRPGGHDVTDYDWQQYMTFMDRYL